MRGNLVLHSCLFLSIAMSVGCSKHPTDSQIQTDIQTKAAADPDLKDSNVAVVATEGKVTLTGKVKTPTAEKKLQQIAKEEPGVSDVVDQTSVDSAAVAETSPAPAPAPAVVEPAPVCYPSPPSPSPKARSNSHRNGVDCAFGAAFEFKNQPGGWHILRNHGQPHHDRRENRDPARGEGLWNRS